MIQRSDFGRNNHSRGRCRGSFVAETEIAEEVSWESLAGR